MDALSSLSALELLEGFRGRTYSPVDVVDELARRIERVEPRLKAFITLTLERAREDARRSERAYTRSGEARPLEGLPLAVKDLFDTAGTRTTYGSPMFLEHVPTRDAEAVRLVKEAGAIVIGKTSTHEFAWGITSYNPHFDSGRNPWSPEHVSGGSSGGSGVALAAHEAPLALGSDTGGSIRAPAAFCGVVGFKPTYGLVSAKGVFPLARSLDHVGPLARTPADVALLLSVLVRPDADTEARLPPERILHELNAGVARARVAVCPDLELFGLTDDVRRTFDSALAVLRELGADVVEVRFPRAAEILPAFGIIQRAEALAAHRAAGLFPARRAEYGSDVRGRLELAGGVSFEQYLDATATRERIRSGFSSLFRAIDVLVTPVSAGPPVVRGEDEIVHGGETIQFRDLVLSFTTPQDLVGLPACAVRAGFDELGIPVGLQFTGAFGNDLAALRVAHGFYAATPALQQRWPRLEGVGDGTQDAVDGTAIAAATGDDAGPSRRPT